jgi:cytochrome c biogenesis protein CcdA
VEGLWADIQLSVREWNFGTIDATTRVEFSLGLRNNGEVVEEVEIISTCDCIIAEPSFAIVPPGKSASVILKLDPTGYEGDVKKTFIINSKTESLKGFMFSLYAKVEPAKQEDKSPTFRPNQKTEVDKLNEVETAKDNLDRVLIGTDEILRITFYHQPGCRVCIKFLTQKVPELESKLNVKIDVEKNDILEPAVYQTYKGKLIELNERERAYPALLVGKRLLQGEHEIYENVEDALKNFSLSQTQTEIHPSEKEGGKQNSALLSELGKNIDIVATLFAGVIDGVNPCAFTTIIFLISSLALAGRRKKEILVIGLFFTLSVFVTYLLLGLGFFKGIQLAHSFPFISNFIRWGLAAVLIVFAGLSFYDLYLIKIGKEREMLLQLPSVFKKKIQATVKTHVRQTALITTAIGLGFLVSIFEMACTGQVYFPFIVSLVRFNKDIRSYGLLALYNVGFIIPLLTVFILSYSGISSKQVTSFFQKHMGLVKLLLAILFLSLAVLTIVLS